MILGVWIPHSAPARAQGGPVLRAPRSALAWIVFALVAASGEAGAAPLVTHFSTPSISGSIEFAGRIDGLPGNAQFQLFEASDDPVSFVFSISLDQGSEAVSNVVMSPLGVFQQPPVVAIGWQPGNGTPDLEPDSFRDVMEYSSDRRFSFGVLGGSWDEFIGGLDSGETSNRFFVAYDGSIARRLEEVQFLIWTAPPPFDPYPRGAVRVLVPEPSSLSLVATGCMLLLGYARRRVGPEDAFEKPGKRGRSSLVSILGHSASSALAISAVGRG